MKGQPSQSDLFTPTPADAFEVELNPVTAFNTAIGWMRTAGWTVEAITWPTAGYRHRIRGRQPAGSTPPLSDPNNEESQTMMPGTPISPLGVIGPDLPD